jgi:hypothetical protein
VAKSSLHAGPTLTLKIVYDDGTEKTIGYADSFQYTVMQGQREIFVVDSPFPAEIAQGATPSMVRGSISIYMPKGTSPESMGLVPYRQDENRRSVMTRSRYFTWRIYDRATGQRVVDIERCKVGSYSVSIASHTLVKVALSFSGTYVTPATSG